MPKAQESVLGVMPSRPAQLPHRLALGRTRRRFSFERRLRISLWLLLLPALGLGCALARAASLSVNLAATLFAGLVLGWAIAISYFMEQIIRPIQTLANVIAALREDDYSFRARGGRRNDAVGDLALEVNALAAMLQARRGADMEAVALLERVMSAMQSPVLAFAPDDRLRVINVAAERAFRLTAPSALGKHAEQLGMAYLLATAHDELVSIAGAGEAQTATRWIMQRSSFRLRGVPHLLLLLSDVSAALREEERIAWQRLIRVIGHEINNSLTPIKSIAGSLRAQHGRMEMKASGEENLGERPGGDWSAGWDRGLAVIESRAESLNRFLQAYSQLAGLPAPRRIPILLEPLLARVCRVETRLSVHLRADSPAMLEGDQDQLQQALINLVKNAADAALAVEPLLHAPEVSVSWKNVGRDIVISILDSGAGIANHSNLFVPFYTTKPNGTGIGLVLALQILEAHGGTLRLRNREDRQGCEAEVRLPLAAS